MRAACLEAVYALAKLDPRIFFIGSDLGSGTLDKFKREMPDRFFMEGIAEANLIGMAAGLALEGKIPYVNTIATFLTRRCFDQIAIDLCLHRLKVRLVGSRGGSVRAVRAGADPDCGPDLYSQQHSGLQDFQREEADRAGNHASELFEKSFK